MTALVRAELLKLCWTRATWAFVAAAVAIAVLRIGLILAGVGTIGSAGPGSTDLALAVLGASGSGVLVIAMLGVLVVTREFHTATWTSTLLVTPNRTRVLTAKLLAAGLAGIVVGVLLFAVGACLGVIFGGVRLTMSPALLQLVVGGLVYAACWGWFRGRHRRPDPQPDRCPVGTAGVDAGRHLAPLVRTAPSPPVHA